MNTTFGAEYFITRFNTNNRISNLINEIYVDAQSTKWATFFMEHPNRAEEVGIILARFASHCTYINIAEAWLEIYRIVWGLYLGTADSSEEQNRLQRALKRSKADSIQKEHLSMALAYWDYRKGNDAMAIGKLKKLRHGWSLGLHLTYIHTSHARKEWDKTLLWMNFIAEISSKQSYGYDQNQDMVWSKLFDYWASGSEAAKSQGEWQAWLIDNIQYLYDDYEEYLLQKKRYKEWIDIMLCCAREPQPHQNSLLSSLEKSHPEVLLPLYHHYVDYWIGRRNREGYQTAVYMIRTLSHMYKKMKDIPTWERFIAHLTQRYSRYRAFQEELKKGKIIV